MFELRGITKTFGPYKPLQDFNFTLEADMWTALMGPNGTGKTTLALLIAGHIKPTLGEIERRGKCQLIFQNPAASLNPKLTVREALNEPLYLNNLEPIPHLFDELGLPEDILEKKTSQISGGEKQRVAIARALYMRPDCIIADEILSALNESLHDSVMNTIQSRVKTGLFITHNKHDADRYCTYLRNLSV